MNRFFEVVLLVSNAMLLVILLVKLDVTPADVYQRVQQTNSEINLRTAEIVARQDELQRQVDSRQIWIEELTSCMRDAASERWTQKDESDAWKEFFAANPSIARPLNFLPDFKQPGAIRLPDIPKVEIPKSPKPEKR